MALSNNVRFIVDNFSDGCTLTVSPSVVSTMPVTNLQTSSRGRKMRTTNLSSQVIQGTRPDLKQVSGFVLYNTTLSSSATFRLQVYKQANWTELMYDSGVTNAFDIKALGDLDWGVDPLGATIFTGWGNSFIQAWFDPVFARSFTLTIVDSGNINGYWDASRLVIGPALIPQHNLSYGFDFKWHDNSQQYRTGGGSIRTDIAPEGSFRVMSFNLDRLLPSDRAKFAEFQRKAGKRQDFFVSLMPEQGGAVERDYAMMAKFSSMENIKWVDYTTAGDTQINIEET